jgi:two-component system nitrate/nitrite response regulator NarL
MARAQSDHAAGETAAIAAETVRVVIASRVRVYRDGLDVVLRSQAGVTVVGSASSPDEVLATVLRTRPDVVLLDLAMEGDPDRVRALAHRIPAPVVVLGVEDEDSDILAWVESGIAGFVTRDGALTDLVAAIRSAVHGELHISPTVAYGMLRRLNALASQPRPPMPTRVLLTQRELQVVRLIDVGLSNKEIAARLGVALSTVKNHVHNILEKLQVMRRSQAASAVRRWANGSEAQPGWALDADPGPGSRPGD